MGFFRELFDLGKELSDILRDGANEFTELMTDGFKEMVVKGNSDYKTSYEKKEMASEIVAASKSSYEQTYEDVQKAYRKTEMLVHDHFEFKKQTYLRWKQTYSTFVQNFIHFVEKKKFELHSEPFSMSERPFTSSNVQTIASLGMEGLVNFGGLDSIFGQQKRVQEADRMLEAARSFRTETKVEMEKLKMLKTHLRWIEEQIKEERRLIIRLVQPMKETTGKMENMMADSTNFTQQEIDTAEQIILIFRLLEKTLTTQFLKENGEITPEYKRTFAKLQEIEKELTERKR